eukprot:CAMPEP_0206136268 /NCGR_PEP_ID=MMETSP1473-20131121/1504_1 /ASSEMBLY_ACC=CAM_ASM_001109 /TAXON_ID=1461547 /ORGANISM="Stichococcus sp, Strain RCC1054" /LENGTH=539 /DNA_ID=CAMNT_0053528675 /DNA_START=215 /DNA_END=1834 /DNA_ORIENTATION=-
MQRLVTHSLVPSPLSGRHQTRQCRLSLPSRVAHRHSAPRDTQVHLSDQLPSWQKDAEEDDAMVEQPGHVDGLKMQTTGACQSLDREGIEQAEVERALPCNLEPAASPFLRTPPVIGGRPSEGHADGPIRSFFRWAQRMASGGSDSVLALLSPPLAVLAAAGGLNAVLQRTGYDASGPRGVAAAVGVVTAIVAVHELGHFTAARTQGIHVSKFAIGFGPVLWSYTRNDVEYSLRAIPLGGFVGFPGDEPDTEEKESKYPKDDPDLLQNRPILDRALVISGGVVFNIIFAYSILLTQVATVGVPLLKWQPGVQVPEVMHSSAAERAGLQNGDIILGLKGQPLLPSPISLARTVEYIKDNPGRECQLTIQRGDAKPFPLTITPDLAPNNNEGIIGVKLHDNVKILRRFAKGPLDACKEAGLEFVRIGSQVTGGLAQLVTRFGEVQDKVSGPVAVIKVGADVARTDSSGLFQFAAAINLNLAVVNALPLPALDGGYMALLALEAARGKKLGEYLEKSLQVAGALLFATSGLFLILRDLSKLGG